MSKKFRALVGAMLSASICSSCTSSGLSNGVKWAVGVPVTSGLVYLGGRKLGFWGTSRREGVQLNYIAMDGDGNLLGDGNDDVQLSSEGKVDICAKKIKKFVGEGNYNVLRKFYKLEKENLEGSGKPVGSTLASEGFILKAKACSSYSGPKSFNNVKEVMSWFNKDKSAPLVEVVGHLEFLFKSIFVTGNAEEVIRGSRESEFCFGGYGGFKVWFTDNSVFISCRHASYDDFSFELELRKMK